MKWINEIIAKVQKIAAYVSYIAALVAWAADCLAKFPKPDKALVAQLSEPEPKGKNEPAKV